MMDMSLMISKSMLQLSLGSLAQIWMISNQWMISGYVMEPQRNG